MKAKEFSLHELEAEVARLRSQQAVQEREVDQQRQIDQRLRGENGELERRLDAETRRNNDQTGAVAELDLQIRQKEDLIGVLRQDAENLRLQGAHLHEMNQQLIAEVEALKNHIRVLQRQNEDLTKELD